MLQRYPAYSTDLKTSLFITDPHKKHIIIIFNMFFSENENNNVNTIIPSNIVNHIVISVKIITITCFFKIIQP